MRDLCVRFLNRRLFQYVEFNPNQRMNDWPRLHELFNLIGLDPDYYLVVDSSSDLPYDFYRPGEEEERLPIHLILPNGKIRELSRESDVVEAISGKKNEPIISFIFRSIVCVMNVSIKRKNKKFWRF